MTASLHELPPHSVRSLLPPMGVMAQLGFDQQVCLKGTGILLSQLQDPKASLTLQQELEFYRNTLELTGNPCIGLQLGEPYILQTYGLFGYAMLSAASFRHALLLTKNFGRLTYSLFSFEFGATGNLAWFSLTEPPDIELQLINLYLDRDLAAAKAHFSEILGKPFPLQRIELTHDGHGQQQRYCDHFDCEVLFSRPCTKIIFPSSVLDEALPHSDPDSSLYFQQQCQLLIAKLTKQSHFIDDVRMLILARPGFFPDIDYLAEKLAMSARTLRRRLKEEGSSYRELLDEVRFRLAREYLQQTRLPMEEVSSLLGYTESGNFSHAFRRWSGDSPRSWRNQHC